MDPTIHEPYSWGVSDKTLNSIKYSGNMSTAPTVYLIPETMWMLRFLRDVKNPIITSYMNGMLWPELRNYWSTDNEDLISHTIPLSVLLPLYRSMVETIAINVQQIPGMEWHEYNPSQAGLPNAWFSEMSSDLDIYIRREVALHVDAPAVASSRVTLERMSNWKYDVASQGGLKFICPNKPLAMAILSRHFGTALKKVYVTMGGSEQFLTEVERRFSRPADTKRPQREASSRSPR